MRWPSTVRLPLSGDVFQAINPMTWMASFTNSQFSVLSVNLGRSSDPDLEEEILAKVGSYGSQLGQIGDVLRILLKHIPQSTLTDEERQTIATLALQLDKIDHLKRRRDPRTSRR